MKKLSLIIATVIACGAFMTLETQAQQGNRNRPSRMGTNQMMMPRMMSSEQRVKLFNDTLKLSEEQQTKLKAVFDEQTEAMSKLGTNLSREERQEAMQKLRTSQNAKIKEILTEDQYKTYTTSNLSGQGRGMPQMTVAQRIERIATELKLTDEQKAQLTKCLEEQDKERAELMKTTANLTPSERQEAMQKFRTDSQAKIKEVLGEDLYKEYLKVGSRFNQPGRPQGQFTQPPRANQMTVAQRVERMQQTLSLSDEQAAELTKFFEESDASMREEMQKMASLSNAELQEYFKKANEEIKAQSKADQASMQKSFAEMEAKIRATLSREEYAKYTAERRELMQKNRTEMEAKLKEILGEEKYAQYQETMRRFSQGNRGQRPQRGGNR